MKDKTEKKTVHNAKQTMAHTQKIARYCFERFFNHVIDKKK